MYIAMNRFKVIRGEETAFEEMWLARESYLNELAGFMEFHLLRGPVHDDYALYSSYTRWVRREDFEAWTHSSQFRRAHDRAAERQPMTVGHPEFEGFEVIQVLNAMPPRDAAA